MTFDPALTEKIKTYLQVVTPEAGLAWIAGAFPGKVVFSTSFGMEDQALTHFILSNQLPIRIFTLDTGRQFQETYSVWNKTIQKYNATIKAYFPALNAVEALLAEKGPNSFYESVENRKECCHIRKVEPLQRALKDADIWITGIRADQSANRSSQMSPVEWDAAHQVVKYHPLFHWTWQQTRDFVRTNGIPYNPLHDKGFLSVGCAPCTRAIREGEDFRSGRWWWEDASKKECGLHETAPSREEVFFEEK